MKSNIFYILTGNWLNSRYSQVRRKSTLELQGHKSHNVIPVILHKVDLLLSDQSGFLGIDCFVFWVKYSFSLYLQNSFSLYLQNSFSLYLQKLVFFTASEKTIDWINTSKLNIQVYVGEKSLICKLWIMNNIYILV